MNADILLGRLEDVRKQGGGWRARCPLCQGRRRDTVSIAESDDGRVLVHGFCGHGAAEIVQSVGLQLADLFPERLDPQTPEARKRLRAQMRLVGWGAALPMLEFESRIVLLAARDMAAGARLDDDDMARLELAVERITSARSELAPADYARTARELRDQHMGRAAAEPAGAQG